MRSKVLIGTLALIVTAALSACSPSAESLESDVRDLPGVLKVAAVEVDGDDALPFTTIPKTMDIKMASDASVEQVLAVFEEYDDDIDGGDVASIEVVLDGPKRATLATGAEIHATEQMVAELVAHQADDQVSAYRYEAYPVLPAITVTPRPFEDVVELADRLGENDGIDLIEVTSGKYLVERDSANGDPELWAVREEFVQQLEARFRLRGVGVFGRGPFVVQVAPRDRAAVRRLADEYESEPALGRLRIK